MLEGGEGEKTSGHHHTGVQMFLSPLAGITVSLNCSSWHFFNGTTDLVFKSKLKIFPY